MATRATHIHGSAKEDSQLAVRESPEAALLLLISFKPAFLKSQIDGDAVLVRDCFRVALPVPGVYKCV